MHGHCPSLCFCLIQGVLCLFVCLFVLSAGNLLESYIFFFGIAEIAVHSSILEV